MKKPNIIFYFSDQQRFDTMGCYGQELNVTPNLDKLAKEGTLFNNAFTVQPVCGPARAVLQTGKYATEVGCYKNGISLPVDTNTIAKRFNDAGYDTAYVGKWHLASDNGTCELKTMPIPVERRGGYKDYWMASDVLEFTSHGYNGYVFDKNNNKVEFIGYRADCINNYAIDYIRDREDEKPFFLFVSQIEPHHQNDRDRSEGPDGSKEKFKDYVPPGDLIGTEGNWKANYPDYLGCCNSLDYNVGRLIDTLKDKGIYDNTIIIYTSDHGCHFRTRNKEYKRSCHESSIRIPLIAHGPGFMGGNIVEELVSLIDVPKTLLDCAGINSSDDYRGTSLKKLVAGEIADWNNEVFIQISESQIGRALRTTEWTYSVRAAENNLNASYSDVYYEDFLYDVQKDPYQKNNLIDNEEYTQIRDELKKKLINRIMEVEGKCPTILSFSERTAI